jgi:hypothetical protein
MCLGSFQLLILDEDVHLFIVEADHAGDRKAFKGRVLIPPDNIFVDGIVDFDIVIAAIGQNVLIGHPNMLGNGHTLLRLCKGTVGSCY